MISICLEMARSFMGVVFVFFRLRLVFGSRTPLQVISLSQEDIVFRSHLLVFG